LGKTSKLQRILNYKFGNDLEYEYGLNFKGLQTVWEKSRKFTKIISLHDLHKYNFYDITCIPNFKVPLQVVFGIFGEI
jgi:hypothetical protein